MAITIDATVKDTVNYAVCQYTGDVVSSLKITGIYGERIPVRISGAPEFIENKGLIYAAGGVELCPKLSLDNRFYQYNVIEEIQAFVNIEVLDPADENTVLAAKQFPVRLQPYLHWDGSPESYYSVAMFVTPGTRRVNEVIRKAREIAAGRGFGFAEDPSVNTERIYGRHDRVYARNMAECIYDALMEQRLNYINPPAIFDRGQKIRIPEYVLSERSRQGTCLDLGVLMAACLETAGIYSGVVLVPGHAFAFLWLDTPGEWIEVSNQGRMARLRVNQACDENRLLPVECTTFTGNYTLSFERAADEYGKSNLQELEDLIDLKKAREAGMMPAFRELDENADVFESFVQAATDVKELTEITISADVCSVINYARDIKGDRIVRNLVVSGIRGTNADIRIWSEPEFIIERRPFFTDSLDGLPIQPHVILDERYYRNRIAVTTAGKIIIEVLDKESQEVLASREYKVRLQPYLYWNASEFGDTLASFLQPNAPIVTEITSRADVLCRKYGISLCGYQMGSVKGKMMQIENLYSAIAEKGFSYEPSVSSITAEGQIIRIPEYLQKRTGGKCTAVDMAVLFASSVEQAGFNTVLLAHGSNVLVGVWLYRKYADMHFIREGAADYFLNKKRTEAFLVFDCTGITLGAGYRSFGDSRKKGKEELPLIECAQDIKLSRLIGIRAAFPWTGDPICQIPEDLDQEDEVITVEYTTPVKRKKASFSKRFVVFCILQEDSSRVRSRHINMALQYIQDYYRTSKEEDIWEAFVYHKAGQASVSGFKDVRKEDNYYIDLSSETHPTEYTKLAPLYFMSLALLEEQWNRYRDDALYEVVLIVNRTIEEDDADRIAKAARKWNMSWKVRLIHDADTSVRSVSRDRSEAFKDWEFYDWNKLEGGNVKWE